MRLRYCIPYLALLFAAVCGSASVLYTNGPLPLSTSGETVVIGQGLVIADSFPLAGSSTVTAFDALLSAFDGDIPVSVDWMIARGAPDYMGGTVVAKGTGIFSNQLYCSACFGVGNVDMYFSTVSGLSLSLPAGTYFLELANGSSVISHHALWWDISNGPSIAYTAPGVTFPSEWFTIYGPGTPEPGTILLLSSGIALLARKCRKA